MLTIDGSAGEGGGQILRTSLALSVITGEPFRIDNIRAGREKPGLLRQHLTGVRAAAAISNADVDGDALGSRSVTFRPRPVHHGDHTFAIGTAGSTTLVLQTVLWPLALAAGPSRVTIEGGTHNKASPPYQFLEASFAPLVRRMGLGLDLQLESWGFYPAGGGRIVADIAPVGKLEPLHLGERGPIAHLGVHAAVSGLSEAIAQRELTVLCAALGVPRRDGHVVNVVPAHGPGNVAWVTAACDEVIAVFTGFGEKGRRAEDVAGDVAAATKDWMEAEVPVDEHLADQLLLPMALAGGGSFRTTRPSLHTTTNADVIRRFLDVRVGIEPDGAAWRVSVG
jgi:RNA 3'-terminal phosphate cyclase (ATP)